MTFKIDTQYLEHSGGTKFYETVLIQEDNGPGLLIKRWGAIALKNGGGQTQLERGSHDVVAAATNKILREKRKKGYDNANHTGQLHGYSGNSVTAAQLAGLVKAHFGSSTADTVVDYFGLDGSNNPIINEEPPAPKEPEKPIERGDTWGSW